MPTPSTRRPANTAPYSLVNTGRQPPADRRSSPETMLTRWLMIREIQGLSRITTMMATEVTEISCSIWPRP